MEDTKGRLIVKGHLTGEPDESIYSGVVLLHQQQSLRIITFLSQLKGLQLWGADIGNVYLETKALYELKPSEFDIHISKERLTCYEDQQAGKNT